MPRENRERRQGIFWMCTIPHHKFTPWLPRECSWIRGQLEIGNTTGYVHWQVIFSLQKKGSVRTVCRIFGDGIDYELTRSDAGNFLINIASEYVWKEDTRVEGTQFELGIKPINPSSKVDWEKVWEAAKLGRVLEVIY